MLYSLPPSILYEHILTLTRLQKNSETELQTSWKPGYGEIIFGCVTLLTWPTEVSNLFGVGRGTQIYINWTINGGKIWG